MQGQYWHDTYCFSWQLPLRVGSDSISQPPDSLAQWAASSSPWELLCGNSMIWAVKEGFLKNTAGATISWEGQVFSLWFFSLFFPLLRTCLCLVLLTCFKIFSQWTLKARKGLTMFKLPFLPMHFPSLPDPHPGTLLASWARRFPGKQDGAGCWQVRDIHTVWFEEYWARPPPKL